MARARTIRQLFDAELEQRFVEAERNALEWSEHAIGRHAQDQATKWMQVVGECRTEIDRRAAGGAIDRSTIETLLGALAKKPGVTLREPAKPGVIDKLAARYILPLDYLELVRLADGATGCFGDGGELRSAMAILGDRRHPHEGYRFAKIAHVDRSHFASFDTADLDADREPSIIEVERGGTRRHRSFVDFLAALADAS